MTRFEEMEARWMFDELGFELLKTSNPDYKDLIMYQRTTQQHTQRITFDNKNKKFACACLDDTYVKKGFRMKNTPMHCDTKVFIAISRQIEELGWLNEI